MTEPARSAEVTELRGAERSEDVASSEAARIPADRIGELYHGLIWNAATQKIARERIHWICGQARGKQVLDVGCSQGISSILLAREGFEVVGIDSNPEAIRFAEAEREREIAAVRTRLSFMPIDLQDLARQTFDTVIAGEVIEHQANPRRFVEHCARFVGENGVLVLTTPFGLHPHPDHKFTFMPRDMVEAIEKVLALEDIDVVDGYIRCTAVRRESTPRRPADLLRMTERAALAAQARLYGELERKSEQIRAQTAATSKAQARTSELEQARAEALSQLTRVREDVEAKVEEAMAARHACVELEGELDEARAAIERERGKADGEEAARRTAEALRSKAEKLLEEARDRLEASSRLAAQMQGRAEAAEATTTELTRHLASEQRAREAGRAALAVHKARMADAHRRADQSTARAAALEAEVAWLQDTRETLRAQVWAARRAEQAATQKAHGLTQTLEALEDDIAAAGRRLAAAEARTVAAEQARLAADARVGLLEERTSTLGASVVALERERDDLRGRLDDAERERGEVQREIAEIEREVERLADREGDIRVTLDRLEADNAAERKLREEAQARAVALDRELSACHADLEVESSRRREEGAKTKREVDRLRRVVGQLERKLEASRETISFRLGYALLHETKSIAGLCGLPRELAALWREAQIRRRRRAERTWGGAEHDDAAEVGEAVRMALSEILSIAATDGATVARDRVLTAEHRPMIKARLLSEIAKTARASDPAAALAAGREAYRLDPKAYRAKWLALLMHDAGMIDEPARLIERAEAEGAPFARTEATRAGIIRGLARVRAGGIAAPERAPMALDALPRRVLYVVNRSLPHDVVGYTIRTQGLLRALQGAGWDMHAATRVGYPRSGSTPRAIDTEGCSGEVDGIRYVRLAGPDAASTPLDHYVEQAAAVLGGHARRLRPALVHAASNHVNAFPALIAARRLGLPFVYEVRGLWEHSAAARMPGWEGTERFSLMRDLETQVARGADLVLTLSTALEAELVVRGVDPARIRVVPNAVDTERFRPRARDEALARSLGLEHRFVIGFLGSLVGYEGLEDLVGAAAELGRRGIDAVLLLVGEGEAASSIRARAEELGVSERVRLVGRVPATEVARYYDLIDVAAFPRLPFEVCRLVPPLKPFEAMAMAKPVVVSDLPALREVVADGRTGLLFPSGDSDALADRLAEVARNPALAGTLGSNARAFVVRERTWRGVIQAVTTAYAELTDTPPRPVPGVTIDYHQRAIAA